MSLHLYKRGKIYHYRGTLGGGKSGYPAERLRGSTGTEEKDLAQRFINDVERNFWKGNRDGPEAILTFARAAIEYRKLGKNTRFLTVVEDYWKETLVRNINSGTVRKGAIVTYPRQSNATRNRQFIIPTMAVINFAASMDLCPLLRVARFPEARTEREPVTLEWCKAFMAHSSPHLGALCCFMFLTGARVSEALRVTWADVDLSIATVWLTHNKTGGDRRQVHMPAMLVAALANIPTNRNPSAQIFPYAGQSSARKPWKAAVDRAGITPLSFHNCRHGFATGLLHKGVDVITIARLGGWKSPDHVLKTYGHARNDRTLTNLLSDTPDDQSAFALDTNEVLSRG